MASTAEDASVTTDLSISETDAKIASSTPKSTIHESVHLKLYSDPIKTNFDEQEKSNADNEHQNKKRRKSKLQSYTDQNSNITYNGLNISKRRFEAWISYTLGKHANPQLIIEKEVENSPTIRKVLRQKWKARALLCDRTELLTIYESDESNSDNAMNNNSNKIDLDDQVSHVAPLQKRGGFRDLLHLYADRFYGILLDQQEETKESLKQWLFCEYGYNETNQMMAVSFHKQSREEQSRILQHFLEWFRSQFPYYYDRCNVCGSSYKEEARIDCDDKEDGSFLGYVYPSEDEMTGKAGRTELYLCHKCQSITRFPRFNKAQTVLQKRQGRCGEYSMLLYRMLSSLGHEARWVVDWADHVWTEILLDGKHWIHLDPCEAAVDKPLLYQEWGKQQTFILGFYAPSMSDHKQKKSRSLFPLIEDLTSRYTSDTLEMINQRREESTIEIEAGLAAISEQLELRMANLTETNETVG